MSGTPSPAHDKVPADESVNAPPPLPAKPQWWTVHLWQIQPVRDAMVIALVVLLVYLGYRLSVVTVPILLAMLLAYLFEPMTKLVTRRAWFSRRGFALTLIFSAFLLVVIPAAAGITFGVMQGASYAKQLSVSVRATIDAVEKPTDELAQRRADSLGPAWQDIRSHLTRLRAEHERQQAVERSEAPLDATPDRISVTLYRLGTQAADWIQANANQIGQHVLSSGGSAAVFLATLAASLFSLGFTLFLTAFFFYFFCTGWGGVLRFWEGLIPEKRKHRVLDLLSQMDDVIAGFIRGRLLICGVMIAFYILGYWLVGVPAPLLMGTFSGLLVLVPYAAWIAYLLAIALMSLSAGTAAAATMFGEWQGTWWWAIAGPTICHALGQFLDDYLLTPQIQGDKTGMDVPTILFASLAGGILAGFYGLLLAIPVAACIKILLKEVIWPRFRDWAEGRVKDPLPVAAPGDAPRLSG